MNSPRRLLLSLGVLLPLSIGAVYAQTHRNGHYWKTLPEATKLHIVMGMLHAYMEAGDVVSYVACQEPNKASWACLAEGLTYENGARRLFGSLTFGQVVDGLDTIYADYRNLSISMTSALVHVAKAVSGMAQKDADSDLERLRRLAAK